MKLFLAYGGILAVLGVLDFLWLGFVSKGFYQQTIGHLYAPQVNWAPVVAFYLLYGAAIVYFAVLPGGTFLECMLRGALLGFVAYMTYDLTNYATLRDWPFSVVAIDIAWGTFITALAAAAGSFFL